MQNLVNSLSRAHRALDVESADVLPVLLQERHQEVDGKCDVAIEIFMGHVNVSNSHSQAQHLKGTL